MPVMMSGEEFVRGYGELYGIEVLEKDRAALIYLLDTAPPAEVMLFNLFLGMARGRFGGSTPVRTAVEDGRLAIIVQTDDPEWVESFRVCLMSDFQHPAARRILIRDHQG